MQLFYVPDFDINNASLNEEESFHATKVLRLQVGEIIFLTNGTGDLWEAKITKIHQKKTEVTILNNQKDYQKRNHYTHLAIAPTKNIDRMEWLVEKLVEIGVDEISFLLCDHSERKQINLERIQKIAVSAMKQSLKAYLPQINPLLSFEKFMQKDFANQQLFMAHLDKENPQHLQQQIQINHSYCILIGAEGDFSDKEIQVARSKGFQVVSLGNSRLRTETAGLVACVMVEMLQ